MGLTEISFYMIFIILLLLLLMGLYFYFKAKLLKQNRKFTETIKKVKDRETNKNILFSNMSDDIYQLTQTLINPDETKDGTVKEDILTSTNNLRELLKIQANKIEVYNENFIFGHMLGDVSVYLSSNFGKINTEIIYDIDSNVPRYLRGDIIHFSRIINNLLEFSIQATPIGKVTLAITAHRARANDIILTVEISSSGTRVNQEVLDRLFTLQYNNKKEEQASIRLYIAKKLTLAIGGTIETQSKASKGNTFTLQVPMKLNASSELQEFTSVKKRLVAKKVLIYSDKVETALMLQALFTYFYEDVLIVSREEIDRDIVDFVNFDLLVLDNIFFSTVNNEQLKQKKEMKDFRIIACSSIFSSNEHGENILVDAHMHTPSSLEQIVELLEQLGLDKKDTICEFPEVNVVSTGKKSTEIQVHKAAIEEAQNIDIDCFTYFKGTRLLIVEDNMINQKIIVSVLKKSGMEIEIANNGQEALDILFQEKKSFDLILMDISMPVMDGLASTKKIREKSEYDSIPIVTFTAFAMGTEIEEMFNAGANAYITKPLNIKKLYNVFYMFLSQINREVSIQQEIQIEGLDIEAGIYHADESEALYKETLKEFVLTYKDMVQLMPKWLKEKRYERVKLGCNELQGMLGPIGAYEMKELVDAIQKNFLYNNEEFLDEYIVLFPQKLSSLIETIQRYLGRQ